MQSHPFFLFGLACILLHEMDAIRCKEWRIFPGISFLKDKPGMIVFTLAHIPLYYFLFRGLAFSENQEGLITGLNYFFIIHLGLHLLFLLHPKNEFKDLLSWAIIGGAAAGGGMDLWLG